MSAHDELYEVARDVLLDALEALVAHRDAIVLVGAQALYLRVGSDEFPVAPFTTDGDLAIDPARLLEIPRLELLLGTAGFEPRSGDSVGVWIARRALPSHAAVEVPIDLLVPAGVRTGVGRSCPIGRSRSHCRPARARARGHDRRRGRDARRFVHPRRTRARRSRRGARGAPRGQGPQDRRSLGYWTSQRQGRPRRTTPPARNADGRTRVAVRGAPRRPRSRDAASYAKQLVASQFAAASGEGTKMAVRALSSLADPDEIAASCTALAGDLLAALK